MLPRKRAVLCLLCSAPIVALALLFWRLDAGGQAELAAAKERLRAAGLPMMAAEIQPPYVADMDNAMPLLARMSVPSSPLVSRAGSKLSSVELDKLAAELDTAPMRTVMELLREATAKPGLDQRVQHAPGKYPAMPVDAQKMLEAARLLRAHAQLAASKGDTEAAAEDTRDLLQLAGFTQKEPILMWQTVGHAIVNMAVGAMDELAAAGALSPTWSRKFSDQLATLDYPKGLVLALDGERILFHGYYIEGLATGQVPWSDIFPGKWDKLAEWPDRLREQKYRLQGVARQEEAHFLDWAQQVRTVLTMENPSLPAIQTRLNHVISSMAPSQFLLRTHNDTARWIGQAWKNWAILSPVQTGLALERYRAAKGEYPATLAALAPDFLPAVPSDRYTGGSLLYRREPGGATVWSAGPNLKDDGGTGDDLVWRAVAKSPKGN